MTITRAIARRKVKDEETKRKIKECFDDIWDKLGGVGPFTENIYWRSLEIALNKRNIKYKKNCIYPIKYEDEIVGNDNINMILDEKYVVIITRYSYTLNQINTVRRILELSGCLSAYIAHYPSEGSARDEYVLKLITLNESVEL